MKISIVKGDITKLKVDAIVNAANKELLGGEGVDGAIHTTAGPKLLKTCKNIRKNKYPHGLPTGKAVIMPGFNLPSKFVIATVGPIYNHDDVSLLKNCYINCLKIAEDNDLKTIAFPSISTGSYGVPIKVALEIVYNTLKNYDSNKIKEITLILHNDKDYELYKEKFF